MCGLVGMISKSKTGFGYKDKDLFDQMLYCDALRGEDSTGVFGVNQFGNLDLLKSAKPAAEFRQTKNYDKFLEDIYQSYHIVVGHNRAATRGNKVDENAHPFIEEHICLVHNGTLLHHKHLSDVEVDSHAICKSIASRGYQKTIPDVWGAYALMWYDAKEKTLFVLRNKERPLWMVDTKDAIYIASEPQMLEWLYYRAYGKKEVAAYFEEDKIYSWELGQEQADFSAEDAPKKFKPQPVQQLPLRVVEPSTLGGGVSKTYLGTCPNYGDRIIFSNEKNSIFGGRIQVSGRLLGDIQLKVSGSLITTDYSCDELENILDCAEYLEGTVQGYSSRNGIKTILVKDIRQKDVYTTIDGKLLTEEQLCAAGYCCHECGVMIDPDIDNYEFWARIKGSVVKKLVCPVCVQSNKKLLEACA